MKKWNEEVKITRLDKAFIYLSFAIIWLEMAMQYGR